MPDLRVVEGSMGPSRRRAKSGRRFGSNNERVPLELIDCRPDLFEQLRAGGRQKRLGPILLAIILIGVLGGVLLLA